MAIYRLRQWLTYLRGTPLHPQWLVFRGERDTARVVGQVARGSVLDIGCGNRWMERALSPGTRYVGLDYPPTVSLGYVGQPDVFGDAHHLPFPNDGFDTVLLLDVLEHLPAPEAAVAEVRRALRTGGILIVQVPFLYPLHDEPHDFQRWTIHGLRTLFARHRFDIQDTWRHGHPIETAAALLAIALAKGLVDAATQRRLAVLLAPLVGVGILLVNLTGWLLARALPDASMMPLGYRLVAIKTE